MTEISSKNTKVITDDNAGSIINRIIFFGRDIIQGAPGAGVQVSMAGNPTKPFELGKRDSSNKIDPKELDRYPDNRLNPTQGGTAPRDGYPTVGSPVNRRTKKDARQLEVVVTPREWNWDWFKNAPDGTGKGLTPTPQDTIFHKANITATYKILTDTILQFDARVVAPEEGKWIIELPAVFTYSNSSTQLWKDVRDDGKRDLEKLTMPGFQQQTIHLVEQKATGLIFTDGDGYAIGVYARPNQGIVNIKAWGDTSKGTNTKKLEASSSTVVGRDWTSSSYLLFGSFADVKAAAQTLFGKN